MTQTTTTSSRRRTRRVIGAGLVAAATVAGLSACADDSGDGGTIRIGTTEAQMSEWKVFEQEAEAQGLDVEVVPFSDYLQPNRALQEGELEANQFQHIQFLADYNVESGTDLVPFGAAETFPMGLYAKDADSVDDVASAGTVAVPNDTVNQGRAIHVLAAAGLVTLRDDTLISPTPADIVADKSKVTVSPVDASQTAIAYQDGTPAVINAEYLAPADLSADDAIYADDPDDPEAQVYTAVWVTTADRADDEDLKKLVEVWHSDKVRAAIEEDTNGTAVPSDLSAEELQALLEDTEAKIREQGGTGE